MGDELGIAGMVDRFHPNDHFRQLGIMNANVLDQLGLRVRRSRDQHGTGVRDRFGTA
jgi:hypothetical protein